ncbi:cold and drought-regulated protein CORA-like [Penaeus monodon]|uniref:cold and drought-regulated protein CORA-like n=1 Tax=Penaeus monodon TaxID=6687 RepID=UPI0018A77CFC|nr:cold and drought-regulated protein CORA-like [Penaeus monodon]
MRVFGHHHDQGTYSKGSDDRQAYAGDAHGGVKGGQNHHKGSKGHHDKGHKDEGFKNVYHKEEYSHSQDFYDDNDDQKYHGNFDDFDRYFDAHRGNDYGGGHFKGGHSHDAYGHKGHQQTAKHRDDHNGHDGHYGDEALSGHKSFHGHYGGQKAQHGHGGHEGGFGHSGHVGKSIHGGHGGGYGHVGHGGGHGLPYRAPTVLRKAPRNLGSFGSLGRTGHAGFGHAGFGHAGFGHAGY